MKLPTILALVLTLLATGRVLHGQTYSYDFNGRLTSAAYTNGTVVNHTYDKTGNVTSVSPNGITQDTTTPVVEITNPTDGGSVISNLVTLNGTASDNTALGWVSYQVNNSPWLIASTGNGWTNWTGPAILSAGTNAIRAFAVDNTGNISKTNSIMVSYSPSSSPVIQTGSGLGVSTNGFGFSISAANQTIVVDACTNLGNPVWVPIQTNLVGNTPTYFSDPSWTNYPGRFYRLRAQ